MKIVTMDGNEAASYTSYFFTEVSGIYPITPSSPMAENTEKLSNKGVKNIFGDTVKLVEMQSEAGAAGFIHGALQSGVLATTYTASQGLLLMIPNMYKIAGEMLPGVIHVAARSLSTHALSIFGDHQDIYAARSTGFCMLASSSVQDAAILSAVAHLSSIKSSLPFMHFFDGFRTSHEINKIKLLESDDYKDLIDYEAIDKFRKRSLVDNIKTVGTNQNDDIYFQCVEAKNNDYNSVADIVEYYMKEIGKKVGIDYKPFNYYGSKTAKKVIVAMGSVCETIKEYIDKIDSSVGLIEVHLYRPFSIKHLFNVLPNSVESIAVLDRTKEHGSVGEPLYLDIVSALKNKSINIVGGRYGLSSKNTTPSDIAAIYSMLDNPVNNFTVGIIDDVTHFSLNKIDTVIDDTEEILIYGYGSDGMVSASKSLIKLIGDNTDNYVQAYFQYDSKKSGGVTVSHLRISDSIIRKTYYVDNPSILVISKDNYLNDFNLVKDIKENGICIINTIKNEEELNNYMKSSIKDILIKRNVKVYTINAYKIAFEVNLKDKISMIMESSIISLTNFLDKETMFKYLIEDIRNKFKRKGKEVIDANIKAISLVPDYIKKVNITNSNNVDEDSKNFYEKIMKREGNSIPVSEFMSVRDGSFKNGISNSNSNLEITPIWIKDNCINCNQCSIVCPHGVIRPFVLSEEEYESAPDYIKDYVIPSLDKKGYFALAFSLNNCTGCMRCVNVCPGLKNVKALTSTSDNITNHYQKVYDYLESNISVKEYNRNTLKGSQFIDAKFKYPGSCQGCGETSYLKLLTQLFDNLIIANATGCSSIYGGIVPSMPYNIPWASSLFEDNAEYGYGMSVSINKIRNRIKHIMEDNMNNENSELFKLWLDNYDDYKTTKYVHDNLTDNIPSDLKDIKEYIIKKSVWCIGGDGWAYDIGYGGIDHVLATNDDINILVLDTEVYSNTGGQASKSTNLGTLAEFADTGKKTYKKDLARMCMNIPNVYVAQVSMANPNQVIRALTEANAYNGPSIVIAYSVCISHGIKGGMTNSYEIEKLALESGYFPTFRYHPVNGYKFDSKNIDFDKYRTFVDKQTRFSLISSNQELYDKCLNQLKDRYNYYKEL